MRISEQRHKLKISQKELAEKLGVTQSAVARWETGKSFPRADMLRKLAAFFGCSIDDILTDN